jgi:hypothetical protein
MGALVHPFLPCASKVLDPVQCHASLVWWLECQGRKRRSHSCFALGQKNKYSKLSLQQGDGVILNGQSAEIDDHASAANGVPAWNSVLY